MSSVLQWKQGSLLPYLCQSEDLAVGFCPSQRVIVCSLAFAARFLRKMSASQLSNALVYGLFSRPRID